MLPTIESMMLKLEILSLLAQFLHLCIPNKIKYVTDKLNEMLNMVKYYHSSIMFEGLIEYSIKTLSQNCAYKKAEIIKKSHYKGKDNLINITFS